MTRPTTLALAAMLAATGAVAQPIDKSEIRVSDGDTIVARGKTYRLVGFDAPEQWSAKCAEERAHGVKAHNRLQQLVDGGGLDLTAVRCSCAPGTEGTQFCNYGRACGTLKVRGVDVGSILIKEGLAHVYICGVDRCPRRQGWCAP
jgi:endonuclease YncB( thermonuclease family)